MTVHTPLPLAQVFQIKATCEDCGRRTVWNKDRIAKEQIRRGLAAPEELGSLFSCSHCKRPGSAGKNISVRVIPMGRMEREGDADRRPLSEIEDATARCCDCGHGVMFDRAALDGLAAVKTVDDLWRMAFCEPCRVAGQAEPNMTVETNPPRKGPTKGAAKVKWSTADVFGENRASPFPNLPASRLFREA